MKKYLNHWVKSLDNIYVNFHLYNVTNNCDIMANTNVFINTGNVIVSNFSISGHFHVYEKSNISLRCISNVNFGIGNNDMYKGFLSGEESRILFKLRRGDHYRDFSWKCDLNTPQQSILSNTRTELILNKQSDNSNSVGSLYKNQISVDIGSYSFSAIILNCSLNEGISLHDMYNLNDSDPNSDIHFDDNDVFFEYDIDRNITTGRKLKFNELNRIRKIIHL